MSFRRLSKKMEDLAEQAEKDRKDPRFNSREKEEVMGLHNDYKNSLVEEFHAREAMSRTGRRNAPGRSDFIASLRRFEKAQEKKRND